MKTQVTLLMVLINTFVFGQVKIFSPDKTFLYAIEYTADNLTTMDTIKITTTGKPWQTAPATQVEIIITYENEGLDTSIFAGQSTIGWVDAETTGAVDNDKFCWFHPPRHNQYKILELAPFPRVEYPLEVGKTYSKILFIGEGWGDISNSKVDWHYKVTGKEGDDWTISAQAIPDNIPTSVNQLNFTFNVNNGFLDLQYTFYNGTTIKMKRI